MRGEPLDLAEAAAFLASGTLGGTAFFAGSVRADEVETGTVVALEYEAYTEVAEARMADITVETAAKFGAERAVLLHRVGQLEVGEVAVITAVAAAHRAEAFEACRYLIDELKARVPIWKKEWTEAGGEWVICEHASQHAPPGGEMQDFPGSPA